MAHPTRGDENVDARVSGRTGFERGSPGRRRMVRVGRVRRHHADPARHLPRDRRAWWRCSTRTTSSSPRAGWSSAPTTRRGAGSTSSSARCSRSPAPPSSTGATWARVVAVDRGVRSARITNIALPVGLPAVGRHHDHRRHPGDLRRHRARRPRDDGEVLTWPRAHVTWSGSTTSTTPSPSSAGSRTPWRAARPSGSRWPASGSGCPSAPSSPIEHERGDEHEEVEFQFTWTLADEEPDDDPEQSRPTSRAVTLRG